MGFKRMKLRRFVHPPWSQRRTKLLRHSSISIGFQFALASLSPIDQVSYLHKPATVLSVLPCQLFHEPHHST